MLDRGRLVALFVAVFGVVPAAAMAAVVFAVANLYQGVAGVLGTLVLGSVLAGLHVATGSLLLPMIVHVLFDLRGLVVVPAPETRTT